MKKVWLVICGKGDDLGSVSLVCGTRAAADVCAQRFADHSGIPRSYFGSAASQWGDRSEWIRVEEWAVWPGEDSK